MKRLITLLLLCLLTPAGGRAAQKEPELPNLRFALRESPHAPGMMFSDRDISADLYKLVSGGWGRDAQSACTLKPPAPSEGQLLGLLLTQLQEGLIRFRSTMESAATDSAPRNCFEAEPTRREMFFAPDMRIFERLEYELTCIDAKVLAEIEKSGQKPEEATDEERERVFASMHKITRTMWFDTTDFVLHNASVLWKTPLENAARLFFRQTGPDAYTGRLTPMPDLLQTSVYLRVLPEDFFARHPDLALYKGLVSGGWGYAREEALAIVASPEKTNQPDAAVSKVEESAFSFRSILEQAQPLSASVRLYPLMHEKKEQRMVEEGGKHYDSRTYTVLLATTGQFNEFLSLREKDDNKGIEERVKPHLVRRDSLMWFEIPAPSGKSGDAISKEIETLPDKTSPPSP